jgi:hypothetical protein
MTRFELFEELGAPLQNQRWSWGGVKEIDKSVFLGVWQHGTKKIEGKRYVWVSDVEGADESLGARERLKHIELITAGYTPYMVMCAAEDEEAHPRVMKDFNSAEVYIGGALLEIDGGCWLELGDRVPVRRTAV